MPGYRGKRVLDLVLVLVSGPIWIPLTAAVMVLARVIGGSPVLIAQERAGLGGRPYRLLKLRTMTNARDASGQLLPDEERITSFGKLLRSTSLDELPQLFNVLAGDMSLVGPRPLPIRYTDRYSTRQRRRLAVKPGITGLSQTSGRNALSWTDKLELDVRYVEQCSLRLDLILLARTFSAVVTRRGISAPGQATASEFQGDQER